MEELEQPTVFVSYSHDDEDHRNWVLRLATRLRSNGVNIILDRWNLRLGSDLPLFMEQGLTKSHRVICICSSNYVSKANNPKGGVGYEKMIITAELINDLGTEWVIPVIRNNQEARKTPRFLGTRFYLDFTDDTHYEANYWELLRDLLDEQAVPIPALGPNPFKQLKELGNHVFENMAHQYTSPSTSGRVIFDTNNNDGRYIIGQGTLMFELCLTRAGGSAVYIYNDSPTVSTVALVHDFNEINEIKDGRIYDTSSRTGMLIINQIAVCQNTNRYFAAIKLIKVELNNISNIVTFDYNIQSSGTSSFL